MAETGNLTTTLNGNYKETIFQNFRGLNRRSDRANASPEFLYDLLNGYIKKDARSGLGVIVQRNGLEKFNSIVIPSDGINVLTNDEFETWSGGASTDPDGWVSSGAGSSIAREGTIKKAGLYSAKLTRSGTDCYLGQTFHSLRGIGYWKGKTVNVGCWAYATVANRVRIKIDDVSTETYSSYHTGDSTWQYLTVTHTISNSSVSVGIFGAVESGNTAGYFDDASVIEVNGGFGSTKKIRCIYEAKWNGGSTDVIIRAGTAWGRNSGNSFAVIDNNRSNDVMGQCAMFKNELIMADGGKLRKMTSAYSVSDLSSDAYMPTDSSCVWVHRDKVWTNSATYPMYAIFSKTNSANGADSWSASNDAGFIDLSTILPEGDTVRGYRTYGGADSGVIAIICDKYTALYTAGADINAFNFVQYFPTTCASINACDYIGRNITYPSRNVFTSLESAYTLNNLDVKTLSEFIEPLYRDLVSQMTDTSQITGCFDRSLNLFYLLFPIANNNQMLVYSVDIKNFVGRFVYDGVTPYSMRQRLSGVMLLGGDGYVYTMNSGANDDGNAISFNISMPALYFGSGSMFKAPRMMEALLNISGSPIVYIDYWYQIGNKVTDKKTISATFNTITAFWDEALWDVSYWATDNDMYYRTTDMIGRGRAMFMEMRQRTLNASLTIPYFLIRYFLETYQ